MKHNMKAGNKIEQLNTRKFKAISSNIKTNGKNKLPNVENENNNLFAPFATQYRQFFEYLQTHTCTATMAAMALGMYRPNACRFKRWLEQEGKLWEINKTRCKGDNAIQTAF